MKEARNPATFFVWTQLRALAAFLEQRSWHRRALAVAEAAAAQLNGTSKAQGQTNAAQQLSDNEEGELSLEAAALPTAFASKKSMQPEGVTVSGQAASGEQQWREGRKRKADALRSHPIEVPLSDGLLPNEEHNTSPQQVAQQAAAEHSAAQSAGISRPEASAKPDVVSAAVAAQMASGAESETEQPTEQNGHVNGREAAHPMDGGGGPAEQLEAVPESPAELLEKEREVAARDACLQDELLRQLDERIGRIYEALPTNALLLVVAGHGDTADVRRLQVCLLKSGCHSCDTTLKGRRSFILCEEAHPIPAFHFSRSVVLIRLLGHVSQEVILTMYWCGMQEQKWRRQQGLDGLPHWDTASEALFAKAITNALHGLCFCTVKH